MNGCINKMSKDRLLIIRRDVICCFCILFAAAEHYINNIFATKPFDRHSLSILIKIIWIYEPYLFWDRSRCFFFAFRFVSWHLIKTVDFIDIDGRYAVFGKFFFGCCDICKRLNAIPRYELQIDAARDEHFIFVGSSAHTIGYILSHNDPKNATGSKNFW